MTKQLQQYEQLMKVTTRDDKILYIKESVMKQFQQALENDKFVQVEGILMAVWNIKTVEKDKGEGDGEIPMEYREPIRDRAKQYRENLGKSPSHEAKLKWVEDLRAGRDIFIN